MLLGNAQNTKKNYLVFSNKVSRKKGFANFLQIDCSDSYCNFVYNTYSNKHAYRESTPGQYPFDINARAIIGFREIGKGHSAMERLFCLMNFLPVMGKDSFHEMNKEIAASYSKVAKECILEAENK